MTKNNLRSKNASDSLYMRPNDTHLKELQAKWAKEKPGLPLLSNEETIKLSRKAGNKGNN